jgi:hypothetical protein
MGKVIKDTQIICVQKELTQSKGKVTKDLQMGSTLIHKSWERSERKLT